MFGFFNNKVFDKGYLPEFEGHEIYYQQMGNPKGEPVLFFHGGPGGSCKDSHGNYFNLKKQRVIMFDQRGCGRSKTEDIISLNDTKRLVKDANRLLEYLNICEPVTVAGGSWGSTLALLFAEKYPERIARICLYAVFLARREDMEWTAACFIPSCWKKSAARAKGKIPIPTMPNSCFRKTSALFKLP